MKRDSCPHCGRPLDSDMGVTPKGAARPPKPKPGDLAVCIGCAGLLVFTPAMRRRKMTYLEEIGLDRETKAMLDTVRAQIRVLPADGLKP